MELALTEQQQTRGLGGRAHLAADAGMLFVSDRPRQQDFWMKDCLISLDIAFIDADMRVVSLYTMKAQPPGTPDDALVKYPSIGPAQYALETAEGELMKAGVKPGDVVSFRNVSR